MQPAAALLKTCVILGLLYTVGSCSGGGQEPCTQVKRSEPPPKRTPSARTSPASIVLEGTVIQKLWTKTYESWNAGGSEYYVLDVGGSPVEYRTAKEGVILRPTEKVPFDVLGTYKGRRVRVVGQYVQAKPYTPSDSREQYPSALEPGGTLSRGSGFEVHGIETLQSSG